MEMVVEVRAGRVGRWIRARIAARELGVDRVYLGVAPAAYGRLCHAGESARSGGADSAHAYARILGARSRSHRDTPRGTVCRTLASRHAPRSVLELELAQACSVPVQVAAYSSSGPPPASPSQPSRLQQLLQPHTALFSRSATGRPALTRASVANQYAYPIPNADRNVAAAVLSLLTATCLPRAPPLDPFSLRQ